MYIHAHTHVFMYVSKAKLNSKMRSLKKNMAKYKLDSWTLWFCKQHFVFLKIWTGPTFHRQTDCQKCLPHPMCLFIRMQFYMYFGTIQYIISHYFASRVTFSGACLLLNTLYGCHPTRGYMQNYWAVMHFQRLLKCYQL